jgi:hypothetical protein
VAPFSHPFITEPEITVLMGAYTYGNITIRQKRNEPAPGDQVENASNAEISITMPDGKKRSFEVRNGEIRREIKGISIAQLIVGVVFLGMMAFTIYFFVLWWGIR